MHNLVFQLSGGGIGCKTLHYLSGRVNDTFGEVSLGLPAAEQPRTLAFQIFIKRVSVVAVYFNFCKLRKCNVIIEATKVHNFLLGTRLLVTKLVAWKPQDHKSAMSVFSVQLFQPLILGCESALACDMYPFLKL